VSTGEIEVRLRTALDAVHVAVEDESRFHAGHGATGGHFRAVVVSERFAGLSRVAAQRLVYDALGEWMEGPIHAFAVRTFTHEQWRAARATGGVSG
jgi:BolA protein